MTQLLKQSEAAVYDGVHQFQIAVVYVRPEKQIADLKQAGFSDVKVWLPGRDQPHVLGPDENVSDTLTSVTYWGRKPWKN